MSDLNTPDPVWGLLAVLCWLLVALAIVTYWKDIRALFLRRSRYGRNPKPESGRDGLLFDRSAAVHSDSVRASDANYHAGNAVTDAEPESRAFYGRDSLLQALALIESVPYADYCRAVADEYALRDAARVLISDLDATRRAIRALRDFRDGRQDGIGDDLASDERADHRDVPENERDAGERYLNGSGDVQ